MGIPTNVKLPENYLKPSHYEQDRLPRLDKRIAMPYAAGQLVDQALMINSEVLRILNGIVDFRLEKEEELRQIVRVIGLVHSGNEALQQAKSAGK
jgi:hypothetical protein